MPTQRVNRTAYAVLGMLALGERSGYDLKKDFEHRVRHFWAESPGQIYPALRALEADGLITSRRVSGRRARVRLVHRVTAKGRRALRTWLLETPGREQVRNELLLKLFFGAESGLETCLDHLAEYEAVQRRALELYRGFEEEIAGEDVPETTKLLWRLTLLSGQRVTEARVKWCRDARRLLRESMEAAR